MMNEIWFIPAMATAVVCFAEYLWRRSARWVK